MSRSPSPASSSSSSSSGNDNDNSTNRCSPHKKGLSLSLAEADSILRREFPHWFVTSSSPTCCHGWRCVEVSSVTEVGGDVSANNAMFRLTLTWENDDDEEADDKKQRQCFVGLRLSNLSSWPLAKLEGEVAGLCLTRKLLGPTPPSASPCLPLCPRTSASIIAHVFSLVREIRPGVCGIVMSWLPGETLTSQLWESLASEEEKRALATNIASTLHSLQSMTSKCNFVSPAGDKLLLLLLLSATSVCGCVAAFDDATNTVTLGAFFDKGAPSFCEETQSVTAGPFPSSFGYYSHILAHRLKQVDKLVHLHASSSTTTATAAVRRSVEQLAALAHGPIRAVFSHSSNIDFLKHKVPVAFCHRDFSGRNMLVARTAATSNNMQLCGLVDFEWFCTRDRNFDVEDLLDDLPSEARSLTRSAFLEMDDLGGMPAEQRRACVWFDQLLHELVPWALGAYIEDAEKWPQSEEELLTTVSDAVKIVSRLLSFDVPKCVVVVVAGPEH